MKRTNSTVEKIRSNFLAMKVNIDIAYNPHHNGTLKMLMLIRVYAFLFSKYLHIYLQCQFLQFSVMNWERQDSCYFPILEHQQSRVKETMYCVFKPEKFFIITQAHLIRFCASLHCIFQIVCFLKIEGLWQPKFCKSMDTIFPTGSDED